MYRTTIARLSIVSSATLLLLACNPNKATQEAAHRSIEEVADEYIAATLERNPTMGTYYAIEGARHDRLHDNSLDALAKWEARQDVWLSELNAIGAPTEIGGRDWVTYGIMHESLESAAEARICKTELWEASTTTAWYRGLPFVFEIQPVDTEEHSRWRGRSSPCRSSSSCCITGS